jgi:hypothetical protein
LPNSPRSSGRSSVLEQNPSTFPVREQPNATDAHKLQQLLVVLGRKASCYLGRQEEVMNRVKVYLILVTLVGAVVLGLLDRDENRKIAEGGGPVPTCPKYCK